MTHENTAPAAWAILSIFVVLYVTAYDLWAHYTHHFTMTHQMDVWLQNHAVGPWIVWFWTGAIPAWFYHLWQSRNARL